MAFNATQTELAKLAITMFGAVPGGFMTALEDMNTAAGSTAATANLLSTLDAFTSLYTGTNAEKAVTMAARYGLDSTTTDGAAAIQYFTESLDAGVNMGELFAAANAFLAANPTSFTTAQDTLANKVTVAQYYADAGLTSTDLATLTSQIASVTSDDATVTTAQTSIDATVAANNQANATQLTTSNDSFVGTTGNDIYNAAAGTLAAGDIILDSSSTDADILYAVSNTTVAPRIQNIETINVTGQYLTAGLALTNVTNATDLNINTTLANGTANVTDANSVNALNINAGANVKTLNVTSLSSGTRDTVTVDANAATTVGITGNAAGADKYDLTVAAGATVTLGTMASAGDTANINVAGNLTLSSVNPTSLATTITADTAASTVTLSSGAGVAGASITLAGSQDITLDVSDASDITGVTVTSSTSGTSTLKLGTIEASEDFSKAAVNVVNVAGTSNVAFKVNSGSTVNLTVDTTASVINVDNAAGDLTTGTLLLNLSQSQTQVTTAAKVDTVLMTATPDAAADTANGAQITVGTLVLNAATNTVAVQGSNNLKITTLTNNGDETLTASSMTGNLTVTGIAANLTAIGGSGNDTFGTTGDVALSIYAGAGDDTITNGDGTDGAMTAYGEDGNDTITGGDDVDTIYGGAGNDTITVKAGNDVVDAGTGNDTIIVGAGEDVNTLTLGAGADTVRIATSAALDDGTDEVNISDFVIGEDKIIITGVDTDTSVNLTSVTPTSGVYTISDKAVVTLTGNTATDLSSSVQLGYTSATATTAYSAANNATVVAGSNNDVITNATDQKATITLGAGADIYILNVSATGNENGTSTITDFVTGTDKIILAGTATGDVNLSTAKTVGTGGAYDLGVAGEFDVTLTGHTETDVKGMVQIGDANTTFTGKNDGVVVGGNFADYITTGTSTSAAGTSSVTGGLGADIITISTTAELDTVVIAAGDSTTTAWDQITGWDTTAASAAADNDVLDLASTNIASVIGSTQVGSITGITVTNGVITAWAGIDDNAGTVDASMLTDAIAFLAANIGGTDTVAFKYTQDENGDGDTSDTGEVSTFVFQSGTTDTLVELIGLSGVTAISTTAAANTITLA